MSGASALRLGDEACCGEGCGEACVLAGAEVGVQGESGALGAFGVVEGGWNTEGECGGVDGVEVVAGEA